MDITIAQWLLNPEYISGVELFLQHSKDESKKFFAVRKVWNLKRLTQELSALLPVSTNTADKPVPTEAALVEPKEKPLPAHVKELKKTADRAWKEARDLHSNLLSTRSKKKRGLMAQRIIELRVIAFDGWDAVKIYERTGKLPSSENKEQPQSVDKIPLTELVGKTKNIPGYITKFKNQLKRAKSADKVKYLTGMIAEKEEEQKLVYARIHYLSEKITELCL